jgi:hypothetical protein
MVRVDRRQKVPLQSQLYKQIRELLALHHIDAPPLSAYCLKSSQPGLVFGFTAYSTTQTRSSIRSIPKVIADMR